MMAAGRRRTFDKDVALTTAMHLFWKNGYSGTSLSDLTKEMGINRPSLYAAFGNKEALFAAAMMQYATEYLLPLQALLYAPDQMLAQRLRAFLEAAVSLFCAPNLPAGCMMVSSSSESAGEGLPESVTQLLATLNESGEKEMSDFFAHEQAQGNLADSPSPTTLAHYLIAASTGLAALARNGATRAELIPVVEFTVNSIVRAMI